MVYNLPEIGRNLPKLYDEIVCLNYDEVCVNYGVISLKNSSHQKIDEPVAHQSCFLSHEQIFAIVAPKIPSLHAGTIFIATLFYKYKSLTFSLIYAEGAHSP